MIRSIQRILALDGVSSSYKMTVKSMPKPETIKQKDGSPGPIRGNDGQRKRVGELGEKWNGAPLSQGVESMLHLEGQRSWIQHRFSAFIC